MIRIWYDVRIFRIIVLKCNRCLIRFIISFIKVIFEVLMYNDYVLIKVMKEGIEVELRIISEFEKDIGFIVYKLGFVIFDIYLFFGVLLDGIIDNYIIVEVKNI